MKHKVENSKNKVFIINNVICKKCGVCKKACPADAIEGKVKETFSIDVNKCIRCAICMNKCKFHSIDQAYKQEEQVLYCKKCGEPLDLPIYLYIKKKAQECSSYDLCAACRSHDFAEMMLFGQLKKINKTR